MYSHKKPHRLMVSLVIISDSIKACNNVLVGGVAPFPDAGKNNGKYISSDINIVT